MSFSLSSLLNPSPSDEKDEQAQVQPTDTADAQQHPPVLRHDSLPPISYVQSPETHHAQLPLYTPPQPRQSHTSNLSSIAELNTTSDGSVQVGQLKGNDILEDAQARKAGSNHTSSGLFELPAPLVGSVRKMSSPTLDQYHVGSRSPEQRMNTGSVSSGVVLAPLKTALSVDAVIPTDQEHGALQCEMTSQNSQAKNETAVESHHSHAKSDQEERDALEASLTGNDELNESHAVTIKQEVAASPQDTTALNTDPDTQISKALSSLKHEQHTSRTQSPLRESSFAIPTTEEASSSIPTMKKRPLPAKTKKGTATTAKKPRLPKKRKLDAKTPRYKSGGTDGTPGMSSPAPSDALVEDYEDDDDESMADSDEDVEGSGGVYCICRKPDNGTFMIGCDGQCDDWFHGKCVSIEERDKNLIDKYICPRCTEAGVGRTSWKRMCRRQGCRLPARVGRNAGQNGATSKYCSDECGVMFFRQMTANARGAEQARKDRATRRKTGISDGADTHSDLGARGGVLSTAEVRAILDQTNTAGEFAELGNGVLSPPATPLGSSVDADDGTTERERNLVKTISAQKEQARHRHQLLKDRLKFITLVKAEANRSAAEKDLKPKEYCGFDSRLEWTEEEFADWRQTRQGQQAFELETLEVSATNTDVMDIDTTSLEAVDSNQVCSRKKCARHTDWGKLTVDDIRFEMTDNSDRMRNLEQEELDIKDRASFRAKARTLGEDTAQVEVHGHAGENTTAEASANGPTVTESTDAMVLVA